MWHFAEINRVARRQSSTLTYSQMFKQFQIKQILNVRHNSKREKRKKARDQSFHTSSIVAAQSICKFTNTAASKCKHSVTGDYQVCVI